MGKILIGVRRLKIRKSGIPKITFQHIEYFSKRGYKVYVVSERFNRKEVKEAGGIPMRVLRWPVKGFFYRLFFSLQTDFIVRLVKPDLVLGHGNIIHQDVFYLHNCHHLAHELIYNKELPDHNFMGKIHSKVLNEQKYKVLVSNSHLMKNDIVKRFHLDESKIRVIYPEYDADQFNVAKKEELRPKMREQLGLAPEDVVIGLVTSGNFKKRNVSMFIHMIAELYKKNGRKNIRAIIAGRNKTTKYQELIDQLQLSGIVRLVPSINNVEQYYFASDIFVLPALIEEFGRSVLEAMGCQLPVVVSNMVGASELLEMESKDYILPIELPVFVNKLQELIQDKALRHKIGSLNHATAQKYTGEMQNQKHHALFKEIGF